MSLPPEPVARVGGRVVLLDADDRVLLIHERIAAGTHWLTPGGGVEAGEHPRHAAIREVWEETGLAVEPWPERVLLTRRQWSWDGTVYDQTDHFFLARVASGLPIRPTALTALEHSTLIGHRWWALAELRASAEVIEPPDLVGILTNLLGASADGAGEGPPSPGAQV